MKRMRGGFLKESRREWSEVRDDARGRNPRAILRAVECIYRFSLTRGAESGT